MRAERQLVAGFLTVSVILGALSAFFLWAAGILGKPHQTAIPAAAEKVPVIVLDPGHGGQLPADAGGGQSVLSEAHLEKRQSN